MNNLIVVVDDSHENAVLLCRLLRRVGYQSVEVPSGNELFAYLKLAGKPKLVILDMMMPEMDGMECLSVIRKNPEWQDIPVVMFSADSNASTKKNAMSLGAQDYMVKGSVMIEDLLSTVQRYAPSSNGLAAG